MLEKEHKWFIEFTSAATAHMFGVKKYLLNTRTDYQQVEIADTGFYGRILVLDGKIQSAGLDEYIYHEALVQPVMFIHPSPKRVLVIGGGEGATLREVLRHPSVEQVVMVDIDQEVVEICKEHLPEWHRGAFDDPRVELLHMDARHYLSENDSPFDVIISDLSEPVEGGPSTRLFTRQFFQLVKERLSDGGLMALQAGDLSLAFMDAHGAIFNTVKQVMPDVQSYRAFIPSFNTDWSFIVASRDGLLSGFEGMEIDHRIEERKLKLDFYDGETHLGMFALPKDIRKRRDTEKTIIDDSSLFNVY